MLLFLLVRVITKGFKMHITSKGQVTIPQDIREQFGFLPNSEVVFKVEKNRVYLLNLKTK